MMRPRTKARELPSAHEVSTHLQNVFVSWVNETKQIILGAPGKILVTADGWSAPTMKKGHFGMTCHFVNIDSKGKWSLEHLVVGCKPITGDHLGENLARFFVSICRRVGIISDRSSKHVANRANGDVMDEITRMGAIKTAAAIWEYNPSIPKNCLSGGSINVICNLWTLAVKAIKLFISSADEMFGPITIICKNGKIVKKILWLAFKFTDQDWKQVEEVHAILEDSRRIQHYFTADKILTLWQAIPAIEELQTSWEKKVQDSRFAAYLGALEKGLDKLCKYYSRFDMKPSIIISIKEQAKELAAGVRDAKNWQDEARKVLEHAMEQYSSCPSPCPVPSTQPTATSTSTLAPPAGSILFDFNRHRQRLVNGDTRSEENWQSELRRYLNVVERDVSPETNLLAWWQDHAADYPILARITIDVLPSQASSVPCERLFSACKETTMDCRARLSTDRFEQLQVLKFFWRDQIPDLAVANNQDNNEIVNLPLYEALHTEDACEATLDEEFGIDGGYVNLGNGDSFWN
ncbi:hypothetical protein H0H81_001913 [Sphagnurus paluster]|uniref:HAT C-terminal dimerisation domain-containing protein n=1 Tax=Sphagnurus paluster TaxID=117069 RepID=A0A9P7GFV5_9AGAR|nr:hypothetical protein H0H81_001913 [Sphagnurus paluster]